MDAQTQKRFKIWQWRTIFATMIGYALFYFVRKNFSFAMPGMAAEYGISNTSFGVLMTIVGMVYGFSRFFNGVIADRMNARYHMSIGLFACALVSLAFGFAPMVLGVEIGVAPHILIVAFAILLVLNNIFQGSGFPPCARLLTHWIPPQELATKMSIWNTSHSIGASLLAILCGFIMGTMGKNVSNDAAAVDKMTYNYVSTAFKDDIKKSDIRIAKVNGVKVEKDNDGYLVYGIYTYKSNFEDGRRDTTVYDFSRKNYLAVERAAATHVGASIEELAELTELPVVQVKASQSIASRASHTGAWQWAFWIPGLLALVGAVGLFALLRDTPKSVGLPELEMAKTSIDDDEHTDAAARRAFVQKMVYKNPIIWALALANFFVYVVRFSVLDWGPKFLTEACDMAYSSAGAAVAVFEILGIIGMLVAGWVTDKLFGGRAHRTCLWCMVGAALCMAGFYYFYLSPTEEPDALLIGVLAMAGFFIYGPQALIGIAAANQATKKAAATANGLVGIFGYLSTAVSGLGVGWLADNYGWSYVFMGVIAMAIVGGVVFLAMWGAKRDGYDKA